MKMFEFLRFGSVAMLIFIGMCNAANGQQGSPNAPNVSLTWGDLSPAENEPNLVDGDTVDYGVWVDVENLETRGIINTELTITLERRVLVNGIWVWQIVPGSELEDDDLIAPGSEEELEIDSAVTFGAPGSYRVTAQVFTMWTTGPYADQPHFNINHKIVHYFSVDP